MPDIPICSDPFQNSCLLSWNTYSADVNADRIKERSVLVSSRGLEITKASDIVCVNPLSWKNDDVPVLGRENGGQFEFDADKKVLVAVNLKAGARCRDGALIVEPAPDPDWLMAPSYHVLDYRLFYKNIRRNVADRIQAHFAIARNQ